MESDVVFQGNGDGLVHVFVDRKLVAVWELSEAQEKSMELVGAWADARVGAALRAREEASVVGHGRAKLVPVLGCSWNVNARTLDQGPETPIVCLDGDPMGVMPAYCRRCEGEDGVVWYEYVGPTSPGGP